MELIRGRIALVFVSSFGTLTSFFLLLSVAPMQVGATGGSAVAGLVTGVLLLGTVLAELSAPMLLRRLGYRTVIVTGALALGLPSLALTVGTPPPAFMIAISLARGAGFGLSGVVTGALAATMLPEQRRGEGLGLLGIVDGATAVIGLPAGAWVAEHYGYTPVVAAAGVMALLPLTMAGLRDLGGPAESTERDDGLLSSLRRAGNLRIALIFAAATAVAGVVDSFLPLAHAALPATGLLVQTVTATIGRWWAGRYGDRHGHARLLAPALIAAILGMSAMLWMTSPVALIAAMLLFGTGFGIIENVTFVLMIERTPATDASALWNLAYDAGYGAGPAGFGLVAGHLGYPVSFALCGLLMLGALPASRDSVVVPARPAATR